MSYIFDVRGQTVWSPALLVGDIYVRTVSLLERSFDIASGCHALAEDFVDINPELHDRFVGRLLGLFPAPSSALRSNGLRPHVMLTEQVRPALGASLVMLKRAGLPVTAEVLNADLQAHVEFMERNMPE